MLDSGSVLILIIYMQVLSLVQVKQFAKVAGLVNVSEGLNPRLCRADRKQDMEMLPVRKNNSLTT